MTVEQFLVSVGNAKYKRDTGEEKPIGYWGYSHNAAIEAMEQWAKIESERFLKWVEDGHFCPNSSGFWFDYTLSRDEVRFYTISQLYGWFHTGIKFTLPPLELPKSLQPTTENNKP
jgi:hypothetical protein